MRLSLGLVATLFLASNAETRAQAYACASATSDESVALRNDVVTLVTGTNPSVVVKRNTFQLQSASASQVSLVTQKNTCKSAALAYHAALTPPGTPAVSRTMVVIKISNNRYVITDPSEKQGEFGTLMVTDGSFNVLAKYSS